LCEGEVDVRVGFTLALDPSWLW